MNGVGRWQGMEIYGRRLLETAEATGAKALRSGQTQCVYRTERRPVWRVEGGNTGEIGRVTSGRALLAKVRSLISSCCGCIGKSSESFQ